MGSRVKQTCTLLAVTPDFIAICEVARFWSSRVSAEKFSFGIDGAQVDAIKAFVFAGLPTTNTYNDSL